MGLLCGVNVAEVAELSPNTCRAPADFKMPGFHHADGRALSACCSSLPG